MNQLRACFAAWWLPARSSENVAKLLGTSPCFCDILCNRRNLVVENFPKAICLDVFGESVLDTLLFRRKSAKDSIPNDQNATVVLV